MQKLISSMICAMMASSCVLDPPSVEVIDPPIEGRENGNSSNKGNFSSVVGTDSFVLLVVDTWRTDSFTVENMPVLSSYAQQGVVFQSAWSSGNWTLTGTMGILSGTVPSEHMLVSQDEEAGEYAILSPDIRLIPDILREYGYISAQASSNWVAYSGGIDDRFDVAMNPTPLGQTQEEVMDWQIVDEVVPALLAQLPAAKTFVHYQLLTPHFPYCTQEVDTVVNGFEMCIDMDVTQEELAQIQAAFDAAYNMDPEGFIGGMHSLYEQQVRETDVLIGEIIRQYEEAGLNPVFIVTGDHGEEFLEHGNLFHGNDLHVEQVQVPLIMWGSGIPVGRVVEEPVSTTDVFPTILSLARTRYEGSQLLGRNLRPLMRRTTDVDGPHRALYENFSYDETSDTVWFTNGITATLPNMEGFWSIIEREFQGDSLLYDQAGDPGQVLNLAETEPKILEALSSLNTPSLWSDWRDDWNSQ